MGNQLIKVSLVALFCSSVAMAASSSHYNQKVDELEVEQEVDDMEKWGESASLEQGKREKRQLERETARLERQISRLDKKTKAAKIKTLEFQKKYTAAVATHATTKEKAEKSQKQFETADTEKRQWQEKLKTRKNEISELVSQRKQLIKEIAEIRKENKKTRKQIAKLESKQKQEKLKLRSLRRQKLAEQHHDSVLKQRLVKLQARNR